MTKLHNLLFAAAFAASAAGTLPAQSPDWSFSFLQSRADRTADRAYERGQKALDSRQWDTAISAFSEVPTGSSRADAALYWKAYALNKAGRRADALAAIAALQKSYASSRWANDAKALQLEIRQQTGQPVAPEAQGDEDLKLMAINSLMNSDPERAMPLLEKVLQGNYPPKIKERALFVLTQTDSPKARQIVASMARGQANPDLQLKAIEYLGLFGGQDSHQALADLYAASSDPRVKRQILRSFMVGGDRARLLAAARQEKDPSLRKEAIRQLGITGARQELADLYRADTSPDSRKAVIEALFLAGDTGRITELARNEKDPAVRLEAIHRLGLMGDKTANDLLSLYSSDPDKNVRKAALHALFLQGNVDAVLDLARKETDPELKRDAVHQLGLMGERAGEALVSMYNSAGADKSVRKAIIDALFLQGKPKPLIDIGRKETDPELKREAIQKLSLMNSKEATDFMMEILK